MDRKILLSLLVFAGGMLNSMASLSEEHKDFVNSIKRSKEEIEGSTLSDPEKKRRLTVLDNRVVDKMNENPNKSKWTNAKKVEYNAFCKKLKNVDDKIREALKKY